MKDDKIYLISIQESIENIQEYTKNGLEEFMRTKIIQDAVIRNLEIVGEATKKISKELRSSRTDIPWREITGLRDVLIHDYMGVDLRIVWNIVEKELPKLKEKIGQLF